MDYTRKNDETLIETIQHAAKLNLGGFEFVTYDKTILNGNFLFVIESDYNGKRLNVYLLKNIKKFWLKVNPSIALKPENALLVFTQNNFDVQGIIADKLLELFDKATDIWYDSKRKKKEESELKRKREEEEQKNRIAEFEKILEEKALPEADDVTENESEE